MRSFFLCLFFQGLTSPCFGYAPLPSPNSFQLRKASLEQLPPVVHLDIPSRTRIESQQNHNYAVLTQKSIAPGGFLQSTTGSFGADSFLFAAYGSAFLGSLICSVGNLALYKSTSSDLLRKWGITGIVFGGVTVVLSSVYLGLIHSFHLSETILLSSVGAVIGLVSIGLGLHSLLRIKHLRSDKVAISVHPWIGFGSKQSMIHGVVFSGMY